MSVLFEAIIEAMDEYYSINLAEEVRRGMSEKAKRGEVLSIAPFGYKIKDKKLIIDEQQSEIIKNAFQSFAQGEGCLGIAKRLNAMGVRSNRGNLIENRTVEYWLNNPVYIGKIRWNPVEKTDRNYHNKNLIISDGIHEPIIDDETWNRVQERIKENKAKYIKWKRDPQKGLSHWLAGVLRCGKCGRVLGYASGFYVCSGKQKGVCDGCGCISINVISKIIIDKIDEILSNESVEFEFAEHKDISDKNSDSDLKIIIAKIEEAQFKLTRIKDAFEAGVDTIDEYKQNKEKITNEIVSLEKLKEEEINKKQPSALDTSKLETAKKDIFKHKLYNLSEVLKSDNLSNEEKNIALKSVVKEVIKAGENGRVFRIVFWDPTH